jgi:threonine aldolase
MTDQVLDLRSDTVTRPTAEMRAAMAGAEVGDDVFDEDPSVQRLERRIADLLGKEAALFVPSGTMSNQIGVWLHCAPGDEFICEAGCHIYNYEQGAYAQLSGLAARPVAGAGGVLTVAQLEGLPRGGNDHVPQTKLICLENTHNRGAGRILPLDGVRQICAWAVANRLATHLDGARLFNAVVASGVSADRWAETFDTVSDCFSKGLGAPVGSALAGSKAHIVRARRRRKAFGGGMRQAGVLAAAALYALDHHVQRLAEDHAHARQLAKVIREVPGLRLEPETIDTNILIFRVDAALGTAASFVHRLKEAGVLMLPISASQVRAVTHLDLSDADIASAGEVIARAAHC